jgi:hypothetical protein
VLRSGGGNGLGLAPSMGSRDLTDTDAGEVLLWPLLLMLMITSPSLVPIFWL